MKRGESLFDVCVVFGGVGLGVVMCFQVGDRVLGKVKRQKVL